MAKSLNVLTGKGYLISQGQQAIEKYLEEHSQAELAALCQFMKKGKPNAGAVSNALKELGWASFSGKPAAAKFAKAVDPVVAKKADPVAVSAADPAFIGPPVEKYLPGRIELLLELLGHDLHIEGIMAAIQENSERWCSQIRKMGNDERELMAAFTGMTAWTLADIGHEKREAIRLAPFKRSVETVAKFAAIDSALAARDSRFESYRYDSDLTAFYCCD